MVSLDNTVVYHGHKILLDVRRPSAQELALLNGSNLLFSPRLALPLYFLLSASILLSGFRTIPVHHLFIFRYLRDH